jgi:hypothetical protein
MGETLFGANLISFVWTSILLLVFTGIMALLCLTKSPVNSLILILGMGIVTLSVFAPLSIGRQLIFFFAGGAVVVISFAM